MILEICAIIISFVEVVKLAIKCIEINELYTQPELSEEIARKIYS